MSADEHGLSNEITFHTVVPVDWSVLDVFPGDGAQSQTSSANLRLLNALNILEEVPLDSESVTVSAPESPHLEAKLDLMLGMLGELLRHQAEYPEALPVIVTANNLAIDHQTDLPQLEKGDLLRVRLFLDARFPQALQFFGTVSSSSETHFVVSFNSLLVPVQEQLDKFIFRQHRRAIASSRREHDT
ncbi:PilZ domain-containing protein [Gammaproteobacteria bacterium AH-315-K14]|nr:PilZ domain-containing protein [Gammaproteobacteria bacterium AH-315-K14]